MSNHSASVEFVSCGQVVDGRFEVLSLLGKGGGGAVFKVRDLRSGADLALKVLAPVLARDLTLTRFVREFRVASRLRDPRLVRAHDFGALGKSYYFTMDLVPGGSLSSQAKGKQLPPGVAVGLVLQLLGTLDFLHHRNIIHRDIKPLNMLLDGPLPTDNSTEPTRATERRPLPLVRLTDFGIARVGDLADDTAVGQVTGTPRYMAPEMAHQPVTDPRVDLFAAGVVLHQLLAGRHPLSGTGSTRQVVQEFLTGSSEVEAGTQLSPDLHPLLGEVLRQLLSRDPHQRPRTAALVHDLLMHWWHEAEPPYSLPEQPPLRGSPYLALGTLVGRERELTCARDFFEALFNAPPVTCDESLSINERRALLPSSVMIISGVPGVGKSLLAWQLLRLAQALGAKVLAGQCRSETESPYEGLSGVLRVVLPGEGTPSLESESSIRQECPATCDSSAPRGVERSTLSAGRSHPWQTPGAGGVLDESPACTSHDEAAGTRSDSESEPTGDDTRVETVTARPPWTARARGTGESQPSWRRIPSLCDREYELLRRNAVDGVEAIKQHELRQRFFFEKTVALLLRQAENQPVLVVVEDVQWADPSTLSLLAFLMRAVALARGDGYPGQVAFCLTHRPATPDNAVSRMEAQLESNQGLEQPPLRLQLEPFSQDQSAEIVAALLMEPVTDEIVGFCRALFGESAPTPLYVEQALRLLLYQGQLTQGHFDEQRRWNGQWNIDPAGAGQAQLPATVQAAIGERAARLSVHSQRLLTVASVEGRKFTVALLARVAKLHENEVLDSLDEVAQAGFVQPVLEADRSSVIQAANPFYRFVHDRYREALYERLNAESRRDIHLQLANAITAVLGANEETAESLARHYACGGDDEQALRFGAMAADRALDAGAFEQAAELYGAAWAAAQRAGLTVDPAFHGRYADACVATGSFEIAKHHYQQRVTSLAPGPDRWDTQRRAAELNYRRRDFKNATPPLEALLAEMGYPAPRTDLGYAVALLGDAWRLVLVLLIGQFFRDFFSRPARDAERIAVLARTWYMLTECYLYIDFRRSIYHGLRYGFLTFRAGDFPFRAALIASIGYGAVTMGHHAVFRRIQEWSLQILQRSKAADTASVAYYLLLYASLFLGRTRFDFVAPALQNAEASGDIQQRFTARVIASVVFHFDGRVGAAQTMIRSIGVLGERYGLPECSAWSTYLGAALLRLVGSHDESFERFVLAERVQEQHGDVLGTLFSRLQRLSVAASMENLPPGHSLESVFERALELTATVAARRLVGACEHSWALAAGALALARSGSATREQCRRFERLLKKVRRHCSAIRCETPLFLALHAFPAMQKGHHKKAEKLLHKALSLAHEYHNADGLVMTYRLAQRLYPTGSPEQVRYAQLEAHFLARMQSLPRPTFAQILEGNLGPSPWQEEDS